MMENSAVPRQPCGVHLIETNRRWISSLWPRFIFWPHYRRTKSRSIITVKQLWWIRIKHEIWYHRVVMILNKLWNKPSPKQLTDHFNRLHTHFPVQNSRLFQTHTSRHLSVFFFQTLTSQITDGYAFIMTVNILTVITAGSLIACRLHTGGSS